MCTPKWTREYAAEYPGEDGAEGTTLSSTVFPAERESRDTVERGSADAGGPVSDADGTEFYLNADDLKHSANDFLDASVLDDGEQVLHFMAALPDTKHAPLYIRAAGNDENKATSFELPGWGIAVILNPFALNGEASVNAKARELQREDSSSGDTAIQRLLFLPSPSDGIADWELDVVMRDRFIKLMQTAIETLQSTVELVEALPELSVLERVQTRVETAVTRLEAILCDSNREQECVEVSDLRSLLAMARQASELTDAAYYDHTMIRQLYFPQEQMLGVFFLHSPAPDQLQTPDMASEDSPFSAPLDGLPAFFTNGSVDDTNSDAGGSSLFFNDAFSAVFMGNFQSGPAKTSAGSSGRAPPGLAAPSDDFKWARGQQEFSRLEEKFHGSAAEKTSSATAGRAPPPGLSLEQDSELDESQVPGLRGLGLDDDDWWPIINSSNSSCHPHLLTCRASSPPDVHARTAPGPSNAAPARHVSGWAATSAAVFRTWPPPPMRPPFPGPPGAFGRNGSPHPPPHMHPPAFKMMTPRDVNFVMQQQMKWLRSSDPFSDDYYFHNYMQKRTRAGVPGRPSVPLPSWKLQHVKSVDPRDVQREVKSRNWESEYHVLGRNAKSSLYRPKQLLNLARTDESTSPPASSPTNAEDPERTPSSGGEGQEEDAAPATAESSSEAASSKHVRGSSPGAQAVAAEAQAAKVLRMSDDASRNSVFANDTWQLRLQLDRGMQCLLSLQDARHLLDARGINVQQFHSMNEDEMDPALVELRSRTTSLLLELAALLGVNVTQAGDADASRGVMSCDVQQLQKMLTATKELLTECLQRALNGHTVQSLSGVLHNRARAESLQALLQRGGSAVQQLTQTEGADAEHANSVKQQWEHHQSQFVQLATAIKQAA
ncbi:Phosphatidylinositol-glycan biosynthesis class S protein [Phytophthora cactorum]|nr:Phosphatidylinositol-glycan biosynthesis class S protein [Phytophthora cactorum]